MSDLEDRISRWRARREAEDAAREAHRDLPRGLALLAANSEQLAARAIEDPEVLLTYTLEALRSLTSTGNEDRKAIYEAIGQGLARGAGKGRLSAEAVEMLQRLQRNVVKLIQTDIRDGNDIARADYRPEGFAETARNLLESYERARKRQSEEERRQARRQAALAGEAFAVEIRPDEEGDLKFLRSRLMIVDATQGERKAHPGHPNLRALGALFRYQFHLIRSESRFALLWTLIGPAVLLSLISLLYVVMGSEWILNMDVPTFSMIGATTWIMFRMIIFRSSTVFVSQRALLNLRPLSAAAVALTLGTMYYAIYLFVFLALIVIGHLAGFFTLPADWLGVWGWITAMGASGICMGVIFGSIAVLWPYFLRFAPTIERALEICSSVFFVSEQLPQQYRPFLLWSPFAHAIQKLRSAYFFGYNSQDASTRYFFLCLCVLILVAVFMQAAVRSRNHPA